MSAEDGHVCSTAQERMKIGENTNSCAVKHGDVVTGETAVAETSGFEGCINC